MSVIYFGAAFSRNMFCCVLFLSILSYCSCSSIWGKVFHGAALHEASFVGGSLGHIDALLAQEAIDTNTTAATPHVICGDIHSKDAKELELSDILDVPHSAVLMDEEEGQVCYLAHATSEQMSLLSRYL